MFTRFCAKDGQKKRGANRSPEKRAPRTLLYNRDITRQKKRNDETMRSININNIAVIVQREGPSGNMQGAALRPRGIRIVASPPRVLLSALERSAFHSKLRPVAVYTLTGISTLTFITFRFAQYFPMFSTSVRSETAVATT